MGKLRTSPDLKTGELLLTGVGVENSVCQSWAETASRQDALSTIFSVFGYISAHRFWFGFRWNRVSQHPQAIALRTPLSVWRCYTSWSGIDALAFRSRIYNQHQ